MVLTVAEPSGHSSSGPESLRVDDQRQGSQSGLKAHLKTVTQDSAGVSEGPSLALT